MESLLNVAKSTRNNDRLETARDRIAPLPDTRVEAPQSNPKPKPPLQLKSPEDVLQILKSRPEEADVLAALRFLDPAASGSNPPAAEGGESAESSIVPFNIIIPGPSASQILNVLVSSTIPNHWHILWGKETDDVLNFLSVEHQVKTRRHRLKAILLRCLSSVAGIGALVTQTRLLLSRENTSNASSVLSPDEEGEGGGKGSRGTRERLRELLALLSALLRPHGFLWHLYSSISRVQPNSVVDEKKKLLIWKEITSYLASGKVLSTSAEAVRFIEGGDTTTTTTPLSSKSKFKWTWISDGILYASWLGEAIAHMAMKLESDKDKTGVSFLSSFTARALSLGYSDRLVGTLCSRLILTEPYHIAKFELLIDSLRPHEQNKLTEMMLRSLDTKYLSPWSQENTGPSGRISNSPNLRIAIGGISKIVETVLRGRPATKSQLNDMLTAGAGRSITTLGMRRALLAALKTDTRDLQELLTRSVEVFGDKLTIVHSPLGLQEANAEVILLAGGYLHRSNPAEFTHFARSGAYLTTISNRLAASSTRARLLGMIVASAFSKLIDSPDAVLKFDMEEMTSEAALALMNLTQINDSVGRIDALHDLDKAERQEATSDCKKERKEIGSNANPNQGVQPHGDSKKIVAIEEISNESEAEDEHGDEDEELMMYEKPDSDASDSEEDPTLIRRSKPNPPVYIRDLLLYLRDTENVDRYHLGISTAPTLIRRKAGFGTEVMENARDLGLVLVSLQDKYDLPKFQELQIQSLVALLAAYPLTMGKWAAHTLFNADLSQSQRSALLVAIGLGARELAGLTDEDTKILGLPAPESGSGLRSDFPTKRLPAHLDAIYGSSMPNSIDSISKNISQTALQPLALNAADAVTGPNALKVRTFSSRMDVEKNRREREMRRKEKVLSKDLHKSLSDGLFLPLVKEFGLMMYSTLSYSGFNPFWQPYLLSLFTQTITIILSTLGPFTPNLISFTRDSLALLITLHGSPIVAESIVLTAALRLFLAVIDLSISSGSTAEEILVTELATEVMELREWVNSVFEKASKGDEEIRVLAAGILVKLGEITERYQGRLLGINSRFAY